MKFGCDGIEFDFAYTEPSARLLRAGESVVVVADKRAFSLRYPHVMASKIVGQYHGQLSNGGETISLQAADGTMIEEVHYNDKAPWPNAATGDGVSLILAHPVGNPKPAEAAQWTLSAVAGGTPAVSGVGNGKFVGNPLLDSDGDVTQDCADCCARMWYARTRTHTDRFSGFATAPGRRLFSPRVSVRKNRSAAR